MLKKLHFSYPMASLKGGTKDVDDVENAKNKEKESDIGTNMGRYGVMGRQHSRLTICR